MQLAIGFKVLVLIAVANGAPLVAKKLLGSSLGYPIDAGMTLRDGSRLLGPTKTIRGLLVAVAATGLCALLMGMSATSGLMLGAAAMVGDLISSFSKRRLKLAPSSKASGLDQVPESLLPALVGIWLVGLTLADALLITAMFTFVSMLASRLLFQLRLRDRPY